MARLRASAPAFQAARRRTRSSRSRRRQGGVELCSQRAEKGGNTGRVGCGTEDVEVGPVEQGGDPVLLEVPRVGALAVGDRAAACLGSAGGKCDNLTAQ